MHTFACMQYCTVCFMFCAGTNNYFNAEPKFSSECFFLTTHTHHIVLQPWLMAYKRRFKELRQIKRVSQLINVLFYITSTGFY